MKALDINPGQVWITTEGQVAIISSVNEDDTGPHAIEGYVHISRGYNPAIAADGLARAGYYAWSMEGETIDISSIGNLERPLMSSEVRFTMFNACLLEGTS